jgi:hypothetical protein
VPGPGSASGRVALAAGADEAFADRVHARCLDGGKQNPDPLASKTASNEAVKFDPRSRIRNFVLSNRSPHGEVAGLLYGPFAGRFAVMPPRCMRRVPCSMNTRIRTGAAQHGVDVQEVDGEDPGGLGVQELAPRRARATRCRVDARGMQDLPDG